MGGKSVATKRSYSRYFIILQEDEKGYSTDSNKFPTGYAKVEKKNNKCKVSYYVQNLRMSKDPYYMVLICDRKNDKRLVKLGSIDIDNYGRAEISHEYDVDNVANVNIPMDNIKGASIVTLDGSTVHGVLTGFANGSDLSDWKSYAIIENKKRTKSEDKSEVKEELKQAKQGTVHVKEKKHKEKSEEKKVTKEDNTREDNIFDKYEKNIENIKNIKEKTGDSPQISAKTITDDIKEKENQKAEIQEKEIVKENQKAEIQEKNKYRDESEKQINENNEENNQYEPIKDRDKHKKDKDKCANCAKNKEKIDMMDKFFCDLVEDLEEIKGVCPELGKCKWYKVDCKDLMNINPYMDSNKYNMVYYPMFNYYPYISRYGHYLLGYKYDKDGKVKYLVYAIPGTKAIYDQPFGGSTGFVTWFYKKSDHNKDNSLGYWAMFYDFKNYTVVVPVKR